MLGSTYDQQCQNVAPQPLVGMPQELTWFDWPHQDCKKLVISGYFMTHRKGGITNQFSSF